MTEKCCPECAGVSIPEGVKGCMGPNCECHTKKQEHSPEKCCEDCAYPFAKEQGVSTESAACAFCECHTKKEEWEGKFDEMFGVFSNYADFCPSGSVYKTFIRTLIASERAEAEQEYEELVEWAEGVISGNAFCGETGMIWQHWLDEGNRLVEAARTHKGTKEETT